jgi:hypothetical protein
MLGQIVFGRRIEQNGPRVSVTVITDTSDSFEFCLLVTLTSLAHGSGTNHA